MNEWRDGEREREGRKEGNQDRPCMRRRGIPQWNIDVTIGLWWRGCVGAGNRESRRKDGKENSKVRGEGGRKTGEGGNPKKTKA